MPQTLTLMPFPVHCAAILAGGKSSRMGTEKALISYLNQPLIARIIRILRPIFADICVVTNKPEVAAAAGLAAVPDQFENRGPLGGIHAAIQHFQAPTFVVACDMPFLCGDFIAFLTQNFAGDALVPLGESGFEPLHAIYSPLCGPVFENHLRQEAKMPSLRRVLEEVETRYVPLEMARLFDVDLRCFTNWNTPEEAQIFPDWPQT